MALRSAAWVVVSLILFSQFVESSRHGSLANHLSHGGANHSSHSSAQRSSHGDAKQLSNGGVTQYSKVEAVVKADGTRVWRTPLLRKNQLKLASTTVNSNYNKSEESERSLVEMVLRSWPEVQKRKVLGRTGKSKRKVTGPLAWNPDLTPVGGTSYYFDIQLGSPAQTFSVDLNTGSDFTWIQCQPCNPCMEQRNGVFDPVRSNSSAVTCSNHMCQDIDSHTCYPGEPKCTYSQAYSDGSVTNGDFLTDLLTLSSSSTSTTIPISFGCGYSQHDMSSTFSGVDGVAGLCRTIASFSSQISHHFGMNVFAHCLVHYNSGSSSTFTIGERPTGVRYTPMVNGGSNSCYYYVNLESIKIGTETLPLDPTLLQTDPDGNGGTIIDSASVLTYFPQPVIDAIEKSLRAQVNLPLKQNYGILKFPVCFDVSSRKEMSDPGLPDIVLAFSGVEMVVKQTEAFVSFDDGDTMCLAVGVGADGKLPSVVGSVFMANQYVVYDNSENEMGFAQWDCNTVNKD